MIQTLLSMHKFFLVLWETSLKNVLTIGRTLYVTKDYATKQHNLCKYTNLVKTFLKNPKKTANFFLMVKAVVNSHKILSLRV